MTGGSIVAAARARQRAKGRPSAGAGVDSGAPASYTGRVLGKSVAALLFLLSAAAPAGAEHEVYYRYTVLGYLKDAAGKPRPDVQVEVIREKTSFSYLARTDRAGFYLAVVRLGDESVGERLQIRADGSVAVVTARFDPADHGRERGTRLDFNGSAAREAPTAFAATLQRFLIP